MNEKIKLKEREMVNDLREEMGARVSIDDVYDFIVDNNIFKKEFLELTKIDDDEYGYQIYITISKPDSFSEIRIEQFFGNSTYDTPDYLKCSVAIKSGFANEYKLKKETKSTCFCKNYGENLISFLEKHKSFVTSSLDNVEKIENLPFLEEDFS